MEDVFVALIEAGTETEGRMNFRRTSAMARKELLHIVRDPRSLMLALTLPVLMLLLFGYALSLDVDQIPTMIYDATAAPQSRELIQQVPRLALFPDRRMRSTPTRPSSAPWISSASWSASSIPHGLLASDLLAGQGSAGADPAGRQRFQYGLDRPGLRRGHGPDLRAALRSRSAQSQRTGSVLQPPVEPRVRVWYNTDLVSRNFIVPGLIARDH